MAKRTAEHASIIRFRSTLHRPSGLSRPVSWTFLTLPKTASAKLPSRGLASIEGVFNGHPFRATLEPDGQGSHWLKVDRKLRESAGVEAGNHVTLEIAPVAEEPEPQVPADLRKALAAASPKARAAWSDITPVARRDWIHWIVSAKRSETRARRIANACDMLDKGKRRPCCFDRSGMYSKSLGCPIADYQASTPKPNAEMLKSKELSRSVRSQSQPKDILMAIHPDVLAYNAAQSAEDQRICDALSKAIDRYLSGAESKIWHRHPVWFLDGNPIAGYSKLKNCIRLLFWSGQSFDEPGLAPEGSFKAAEARFTSADQIVAGDLKRWLTKSARIQWDYKNIVKRKGRLERLK